MTIDFDTITNAEAEAEIDRLYAESPEVVDVVIATLEVSDPLAGPVRVLREVMAVLR